MVGAPVVGLAFVPFTFFRSNPVLQAQWAISSAGGLCSALAETFFMKLQAFNVQEHFSSHTCSLAIKSFWTRQVASKRMLCATCLFLLQRPFPKWFQNSLKIISCFFLLATVQSIAASPTGTYSRRPCARNTLPSGTTFNVICRSTHFSRLSHWSKETPSIETKSRLAYSYHFNYDIVIRDY